jgi:quercetin dioxygenase-like cupin family protein
VGFHVVRPDALEWTTRPHEPGEAARSVAELSESLGFAHTRANVWRYEPGAKGRRHRHRVQEETFVVLSGTLSMYLGDPAERVDVPPGGVIHVEPGTELQAATTATSSLSCTRMELRPSPSAPRSSIPPCEQRQLARYSFVAPADEDAILKVTPPQEADALAVLLSSA